MTLKQSKTRSCNVKHEAKSPILTLKHSKICSCNVKHEAESHILTLKHSKNEISVIITSVKSPTPC